MRLRILSAFVALCFIPTVGSGEEAKPACGCTAADTSAVVAAAHLATPDDSQDTVLAAAVEAIPTGCSPCVAPGCDGAGCDGAGCDIGRVGCDTGACPLPTCDTGCGSACFCCCDRWTFVAESMFLRRANGSGGALFLDQNTGDPVFGRDNLEFDHVAVPRLQVIREYGNCWGWDLNFFGTDAWDSTTTSGGEISPVLVGPGINFGSTAPGTIFQANYGTELYSFEANLRHRCHECVTFLAGFRWIELGDTLQTFSVAPVRSEFYTLDTTNQLYGFQLGADATLLRPSDRFRVDGIVRAGIMGSNIDYHASSPVLGVPGTVSNLAVEDSGTAFVGELGVRAVLGLTSNLSIIGGYQALWLDGVASAPDQLDTTSLVTPISASIDTGTVFFHGATVGLQATF
jgi:hypothetical protein